MPAVEIHQLGFFALPKPVESIGRTVVYVGLSQLRQWTNLLAMAGVQDKPRELMRLSLARAKMCELLCKEASKKDGDVYFTVGLFSALGALFGQPLYEIVQELPLSETIKGALLNHAGDTRAALQCTLAYETCKWPEVIFADLGEEQLRTVYLDAVHWSFGTFKWLNQH